MENSTVVSSIIPQIVASVAQMSFSWYDYLLFSVMLGLSSLIGIYFGCFGSKQSTANEYLMGNKEMTVFPVSISLIASHISGITLLAIPAEIYRFGASYWLCVPAVLIVSLVTTHIYLPVFHKLGITSTYEYLERRFDTRLRSFASFLFALGVFLYLPIVIYIPALAFSTASGINLHYITPVVCGVCIFYTTIGGLKAVVWTDALQFIVTFGAVVVVFGMGLRSAGGFGAVWRKAREGHRLDIFDFDFDPTKRDSFWISMIGISFGLVHSFGIHQSCVQKFLSVPTLKDAKRCVYYFNFGVAVVVSFCIFTGLIMYSKYSNCDPFTTKLVTKNDQLLPYYVLDVASSVPGLPGLFIAGIFCAALSTLSASLNCLAGTIFEDFIRKYADISEQKSATILKLLVIVIGVICTALVFLIERMGEIIPMQFSLAGVTAGPLVGMFTLGVFFPRASSKGALYGSIFSLVVMLYVVLMTQWYKMNGYLQYDPKPTSIAGCAPLNVTSIFYESSTTALPVSTTRFMEEDAFVPFYIFRISYFYYTPIGTTLAVVVGLAISYLCRNDDPPVHRDLLTPIIYRFIDNDTKINRKINYLSVEKGLQIVTSAKEIECL